MKRAYGSEPILFDVSPVSNGLQPGKRLPTRRWRKVALGAAIGLLLAGGLAVWLLLVRTASTAIIPVVVRETVLFPLLEPRAMPPGFTVDTDSFQATAEVVTYAIMYDGDKKLIVSEQAVPANFDFDAFHQEFENSQAIPVATGMAVMGHFEGMDLASIVSGNTWALVRAPEGIDRPLLEAVAGSFRPLEQ